MEQFYFSEIIERITEKLTNSDEDTVTDIYNQLFDIPVMYVGDDLWEEEIHDADDIIDDDDTPVTDTIIDDDDIPITKKNTKYNDYDSDFGDDD